MKSKMVLCDKVVGQVVRQAAILGQGFATGVKIGYVVRQLNQDSGVVVKTRAVLGLS